MATRGSSREALSDDELLAMGGRSSRAPAWLGRLFAVGALTFAVGYYLPLHRTHTALVTEYTSLAERVTGVEKDLVKARADLLALTAKNQELSLSHQKEATGGGREASRKLEAELSSKLSSRIEKQELTVGSRAGRVRVALRSVLKQAQAHWEVTSEGQAALCDVAEAVTNGQTTIVVTAELADGKAAPGGPSPRDAAGARAAAVARSLEQKCGLSSDRIATMTRRAAGGSAGPEIALELETPGG